MPKNGPFIKHLGDKIEDFTVLFLLPLFFAYTGLKTELGLLGSVQLWLICGLIVLVAIAGKFGGVTLAARFYGMNWRRSALLGVLMNTRGLMELIILNIGLSFGVLSKPLFAMMVVMALVTTFMTTPLMRLLYSPQRQRKELEEAAREEAAKVSGIHVVVPVSLQATAPPLVRIGGMLMANDKGRLYAIHLERPDEVDRRAKNVVSESNQVLEVAQSTAKANQIPINAISFVSRNIGYDIADAARRYLASWVVMGWHKPVFFKNVLGGVVGQVLRQAPSNIAIFCDKGMSDVKRIVVPYLGETQDRGALLAAERMGRLPGVSVTILHVVKPNRSRFDAKLSVQNLIDKELTHGSQSAVRMQVVESESPVIDVVVEHSREYDLMILGLSEEWNLSGDSLSGKHESAAQSSHCSLLIVHANPRAPVMQAQLGESESEQSSAIPLSA
jgi:nucleotide-binding universal stress UspA family protein